VPPAGETCLMNAEVGENDAAETCAPPDEKYFQLKTSRAGSNIDKIGSGVTDTKVPEPCRFVSGRNWQCTK
jgi:hypothetical protein